MVLHIKCCFYYFGRRCPKPLKPTLTVQVATDSARSKESVEPLSIVSAVCTFKQELKIAYGSGTFLSFENVVRFCSTCSNFMPLFLFL